MESLWNFEIIPDKFNVMGIYTSENYAHNWIINCIITNL